MRKLKVAELVYDFGLYPRNNVDEHNVRNLVDALVSGATLPPLVIDRKSKRVVDGFHRGRAIARHFGEDAETDVVEKVYADDAAMFLDAMRFNAAHGAKLDPCDRNHCMIIAGRLRIPLEAVAGALHMPADKLGHLHNSRTAIGTGGLSVPLKRPFQKFAGRKLTKRQQETNERSSGMNQVFYVNQLIDMIEAKMLDMDDEHLLDRLQHLHTLLDSALTVK